MLSDLLVHTVEVYARSGRTDRFGQPKDVNPGKTTGSPVATYPCRVDFGQGEGMGGGLALLERAVDTFERFWTMYTMPNVDLNEDDAVRVLDAGGNVLVNKAKVKASERVFNSDVQHHREYVLIEQSGPNPERG